MIKDDTRTMKIVKFIVTGIFLAATSIIWTLFFAFVLYAVSVNTGSINFPSDFNPHNLMTYSIILPSIFLSILFSSIIKTNKSIMALIQGVIWAAIQFALILIVGIQTQSLEQALENPMPYIVSIGIFIGSLLCFKLNRD
jgi:hypothetical protein